ncbi:hypothetical protein [Streptococcus dentiloxodontae]
MDVSELAKTLNQYNPTVNATVNDIVSALRPMGYVMVGLFFLIEMDNWDRAFAREGGGLTKEKWFEIGYKYLLALVLVRYSSHIVGGMVELFNIALRIIDGAVSAKDVDTAISVDGVKGYFAKTVLNFVGAGIEIVMKVSTRLLMFLRYMQMYIIKAAAPILVACYMSEATRQIVYTALRFFASVAFQGVVILIILRIFPVLMASDLLDAKLSGSWETWAAAFTSVGKGLVYIFVLFGSQRLARSLIGAM